MSTIQKSEKARSSAARTPHSRRPPDFHPEIQGLRAVVVLLVVLYHLWPNRLSGGFVGVDVFFVISGYLITAHIHREVVTAIRCSRRVQSGGVAASAVGSRPSSSPSNS